MAVDCFYLKVPVEAGERPVLLALVLQEQRALVHSELLQVPATNTSNAIKIGVVSKVFVSVNEALKRTDERRRVFQRSR